MTSTPPGAYGDYQFEIYAAGLGGVVPAFPMAYPSWKPAPRPPCRRLCSPPLRAAQAPGTPSGPTSAPSDGVVHVLRSILAEADLIMAVDGYPALADLTPGTLRRTGPHD